MPRSVNVVASRNRRKKILKKTRGYFGARANGFFSLQILSPKTESETLKKLNETAIEYQMQEAERKARLELVELNQNYRLSETIKHFKQNAYGNAKTTNKNNHDS